MKEEVYWCTAVCSSVPKTFVAFHLASRYFKIGLSFISQCSTAWWVFLFFINKLSVGWTLINVCIYVRVYLRKRLETVSGEIALHDDTFLCLSPFLWKYLLFVFWLSFSSSTKLFSSGLNMSLRFLTYEQLLRL